MVISGLRGVLFGAFVWLGFYSMAVQAGEEDIENLTRLDAFVMEYEALSLYSGVILVARGDEVVFQKSYGKANFEFDVPNTADTRFRIASISKAFTKIAIGKLFQDGKLALDDPLARYFPDFSRADEITIQQILDHRSGIPHLNGLPWYEELGKTKITLGEIIDRLKGLPLDFDPGTDRSYSNGGYAVLAALIEKLSGKNFYAFLREDILEPLDLYDTGPEKPFSVVKRLASGYKPGARKETINYPRFVATAIKIGGGGFYSSPNDLLKFSRLLYQDNVLSPETWEAIFPKREVLFLDGRRPGYFSNFIKDFVNDVTIINLSNMYLGSFGFDDALLNITLGKETNFPEINIVDKKFTKNEVQNLVGNYVLNPIGTHVEIIHTSTGDWVYRETDLGSEFAFLPISGGRFYATQYDLICSPVDGAYLCKPRLLDFSLQLSPATLEEATELSSQ